MVSATVPANAVVLRGGTRPRDSKALYFTNKILFLSRLIKAQFVQGTPAGFPALNHC